MIDVSARNSWDRTCCVHSNPSLSKSCTDLDSSVRYPLRYPCGCHQPSVTESREFCKRWQLLSERERKAALCGSFDQFMHTAADILHCLGCRSSTEELFYKLSSSHASCPANNTHSVHAHLRSSGLVFDQGSFKLEETFLSSPAETLALFLHHKHSGTDALAKVLGSNALTASKHYKLSTARTRCPLHSQRARGKPRPSVFEALWLKLSLDQQRQLSRIDSDQFLTDLEAYLRRHRFCSRCKEKVLEAYDLLTAGSCSEDECESCAAFDDDKTSMLGSEFSVYNDNQCDGTYDSEDLHYTSYLFNEITFSRSKNQLFLPYHLEYMMQLVSRADQEFVGDWGDRHARTIAEAQDEVLTCLGMVLWDKVQGLWTKIRTDRLCQELLLHCSVTTICRNFDMAVEALHGHEIMEQLLAEEDDESRRLERKKEKRKERKKKRKNAKQKQQDKDLLELGSNVRSVDKSPGATTSSTASSASHDEEEDLEVHFDSTRDDQSLSKCFFSKSFDLDNQKEMQLLSSMGWDSANASMHFTKKPFSDPSDQFFKIPDDDIAFWKKNKTSLVSKRLAQRQKLQERFDQFLLRNKE